MIAICDLAMEMRNVYTVSSFCFDLLRLISHIRATIEEGGENYVNYSFNANKNIPTVLLNIFSLILFITSICSSIPRMFRFN